MLNKTTQNVCCRHYYELLRNSCLQPTCPTFQTNCVVFNLIKKFQKELTTQAYKLVQPNEIITDICEDFLRLWSLANHSTMPFIFHGSPLCSAIFLQLETKSVLNWLLLCAVIHNEQHINTPSSLYSRNLTCITDQLCYIFIKSAYP